MRRSMTVGALTYVVTSMTMLFAGGSAHANNIVIVAADPTIWQSGGQSSGGVQQPLVVQVKQGDTIQVQIPAGLQHPHGFVTLNKPGNQNPSKDLTLVLACGDDPKTKPNAVLQETCAPGTSTNFNKAYVGSMTLQVLNTFQADVNFWCVVHLKGMWGVIKLQQ